MFYSKKVSKAIYLKKTCIKEGLIISGFFRNMTVIMDYNDLPKTYDASEVEQDIYKTWEESGYFDPDKLPERHQNGEPYCIVLPPPNRTGTLHMGHAKMLAVEDLLIRFYRMQGRKTYWVPGTDHAAISTQVKVEQLLVKRGMKDPRRELGREKFLDEVKKFAQQSRDTIVTQCQAMGASMDWNREKYTLDEKRNKAVNHMFKMMYEDGLIERGFRVVNWDPQFKTTLSDDEVFHKETQAELVTFKYDKDFPIAISTTRAETKFGDTAVAVHPDDERYKEFVGQTLTADYCGKHITVKIIADKEVDPKFGTGALGVTPAHSMIDSDMAERHGLPMAQVIGQDARMTAEAGDEFQGLTTIEARSKAIKMLESAGCLIKKEIVPQNLMIAERGGETVEQLPMRQWFVRVNKPFKLRQNTLGKWSKGEEVSLKDLMRYAVTSRQTRILPENFERQYLHWVNNLRDWCISRQIWFGHQIPVWYRRTSHVALPASGNSEEGGQDMWVGVEPEGIEWERDPDTLDTWFSSGMWTFSVFNWPENAKVDDKGDLVKTGDLAIYHPTNVLETGYDILPFWVARMLLMTTYALGEVPFYDSYLHGLVRDDQGRKMSKSLDNILNPLDLIPKFGTDAVRLSLVMGTSPGLDQKLSEEKIKDFRNFTNKLWNISRFVLQSTDQIAVKEAGQLDGGKTLADHWILSRFHDVQNRVTALIKDYQLSQAGELLRDFTWSDLADWYLEISKIEKDKDAVLWHVLPRLLKLWHPFMPFVTEHIWKVGKLGSEQLIVSEWPSGEYEDLEAEKEFGKIKILVTDLRRLRSEHGIEPVKFVEFAVVADRAGRQIIEQNMEVLKNLSRAEKIVLTEKIDDGWAVAVSGSMAIGLNLAGAVDTETEKMKLRKEMEDLIPYIVSTKKKLSNSEFTAKAPEKVVQDMRDKLEESGKKLEALEQRLKSI